jgi:hypothetical protein
VAATQGRGFWVLDDLFVVREAATRTGRGLHLYSPGTVAMITREGWGEGEFEGSNPPRGVPLYYELEETAEAPLTIDIFDGDGRKIRSYSSEESDFERCLLANEDPRRPVELEYPAAEAGLNKWVWNLHRENVHCIEDVALFGGFGGATVAPGAYSARVSIGDRSVEAGFRVVPDPRDTASEAERRAWSETLAVTEQLLDEILRRLGEARKARAQIEGLMAEFPADDELQQAGKAAVRAITAWDHLLNQHLHETYEDEDAWATMLAGQVRYLLDVIDATGAPVTGGQRERLADLQAEWAERQAELQAIADRNIEPINEWAEQHEVRYVSRPGG